MSEEKPEYIIEAMELLEGQAAARIESPRVVRELTDDGLKEYRVWGWVKVSAKFIAHIKKLKGAKLAIWQTIALSIDEVGECNLSVNDIAELTDYSRSEVIESLKELDEMGYLSVIRQSGRKSMYIPEFAARGLNSPSDQSRKTTSPVPPLASVNNQSSPSEGNAVPSIKSIKRVKSISKTEMEEIENRADKAVDTILQFEELSKQAESEGKAWRGREILMTAYLPYGDWWHGKTGLHMYSVKGKTKKDFTWIKEFQAWYDNEITIDTLEQAYGLEVAWKKVIAHPRELTAKAIAIQSAPKLNSTNDNPEGKGFYV